MPCPPIDQAQAAQFLQLLGKTPATTRLRAFPHRLNPNRAEIKARKGAYNLQLASRWQQEGRGVYAVINDGGDKAEEITTCRAFFVEWDNRPVEWQRTAWQTLGLPQPTFMVSTGGKSVHCYWVLDEPIARDEWEPVQAALIAHCDADRACKDASRVMRLPGAHYIGPSGEPTGTSEIINPTGNRYSLAAVLSWLPSSAPEHSTTQLPTDLPPRPPEALLEALKRIPPFQPKAGQYQQLLGLARRLYVEVGRDEAQRLLQQTCASAIDDLDTYFTTKPRGISPGSVWPYLRDQWRIDISRRDLKRSQGQPRPERPQQRQQQPEPQTLSLAEVRSQLAYAIGQGITRADLEVLRIELAHAADLQPQTLQGIVRELLQEHEAAISIDAEKSRLQAAARHRARTSELQVSTIMPAQIAWALETRTRTLPADSIAASVAYLACCSSVVKLGTEIIASRAHDFRAPLNLYCALVARSGAKKSPTSRLLIDHPTKPLRAELAAAHDRAMQAWRDENRGKKPADRSEPPRAAYISVSDFTSEALTAQLQEQEARGLALMLNRDELSGLFGSLNQYRKGRGGDEQLLLEAYDGSPFFSLRIANGGRFYGRCHLSIWGSIQPAILRELISTGDASGLWARFMFVPLPDRIVPLPAEDSADDLRETSQAASDLADVCRCLYTMPRQSLELSPDARAAFVAYERLTQEQIHAAQIDAQGALLGKAAGKVLRVAGLMHLISVAVGERSAGSMVDDEMVNRAVRLVDHLNAWTMGLHEDAATDQADDLMRLIHRIAESAGDAIGCKDVRGRFSRRQRQDHDAAAVAAAMQGLAEIGVGIVEKGQRDSIRYRATGSLA